VEKQAEMKELSEALKEERKIPIINFLPLVWKLSGGAEHKPE